MTNVRVIPVKGTIDPRDIDEYKGLLVAQSGLEKALQHPQQHRQELLVLHQRVGILLTELETKGGA